MQVAVENETKFCKRCEETKEIHEFHVDRSQRDERKQFCRLCTNKVKAAWRKRNNDRVLDQKRESYNRNREHYHAYYRSEPRRSRVFAWRLKRQFGITVQQFEEMLEAQAGCCAICGELPQESKGHRNKHRLHVDHDHETGVVRGLLCNNCNAGLGYLGDSVKNLRKAVKYLSKNKTNQEKH